MKNSRVAKRYAQALMMTADAPDAIDEIAGDLEQIKKVFNFSRELRRLLDSPIVAAEKKMDILRELFAARVGKTTLSFLALLIEKQREGLLLDVAEQYLALRDLKYGIVNVDVASAVEMTPQQEKNLSEKLEHYTKKKVRVRFSLDKALKGGLRVKIGDTVLDASVRRQLELVREQFLHGHALN
jgi:F-type H+-transporting ATPase subunit delta